MPLFNGSILFFLNASSFTASATATTIHTNTKKPTRSSKSNRVSHSNMSIYGQDLMPIHPANFALMNPTPMG
ncbi:hypothetical protein NC653_013785 [Populus alba x Populus x berolinensis]|uniref:Secreted protein n=1 Tax=Populus alba x Populus x berolinensis TaxID=444605 RepID=A0AAD6QVL5_9ROSI|nr:hypothetical protein NC653_013785 [Populus alba x Populus x berolinensis]